MEKSLYWSKGIDIPDRAIKLALLMVSALLLFAANFNIGFRVTVGDWVSTGIYSPRALASAVEKAEALASDILCRNTSLRDAFSVSLRVTPNNYARDTRVLERTLLETAPGIVQICAVRVNGELVGWVSDASELGEVLDVIIGEKVCPETISAGFEQRITAEYSYAPADMETDITTMSKLLRECTTVQVVNMEPDDGLYVSGMRYDPPIDD